MVRLFLWLLLLPSGLVLSGCIEPYTPHVPPAEQTSLVVDGFINPRGRTTIKLARTFRVNTTNMAPTETRARVTIQNETGQNYSLSETTEGTYVSAALTLDPSLQYQLHISTAQGREYVSDLVPVVLTPPIDTLTWQVTEQGGVQVYLSTHNTNTASQYYRWEYDETWQFTSAFPSAGEYVARTNSIEQRSNDNQIYSCWRTESSTSILQSNTTQLGQNNIRDYPLLLVPPTIKLRIGYSLLVRQYAQTQAEYDYWERLRKNTENLGTVNDPLPARVTGNVHALADPTEVVLGYVGVHTIAERRLFVAAVQLPVPQPSSVFYDPFYANCEQPLPLTLAAAIERSKLGAFVPVQQTTGSYTVSTKECVDCRVRGTNVKPGFWP